MPKLSKSINKDNEKKKIENEQSNWSLSKKVEKENNRNENNNENIENASKISVSKEGAKIKSVASVIEITDWLLSLIGDGVFEQLKTNPYLQLPYTSDDITTKEWLAKAIKTIFTQENIKNIGTQIHTNHIKIVELQQAAQKAEAEKIAFKEKFNQKFQAIKAEIGEVEDDKYEIEKQLHSAIPISLLINEFYRDPEDHSEELKKLINTLQEALTNKDDKVAKFIMRFSKGYLYLKSTFEQLSDNEKDNLNTIHNALTVLLSNISNIHIAERRPLLDIIAKICSNKFSEYDIISPEQTLQLDPEIHNAAGKGSATIIEGITFAAVRKKSRKAVIYADVIV